MPKALVTKRIWKERFEDINAFERYFARQGFVILKFFLHVSRKEQRNRFLARLDRPEKNWKFAMGDLAERSCWRAYMTAYDDMIRHTAAKHAPWVIVPADDKKFARTVVAAADHRRDGRGSSCTSRSWTRSSSADSAARGGCSSAKARR